MLVRQILYMCEIMKKKKNDLNLLSVLIWALSG